MSIKESLQKIKGKISNISQTRQHQIFMALLIVFVGTACFGLGRLSVISSKGSGGIRVFDASLSASVIGATDASNSASEESLPTDLYVPDQGGEVVASKSGTKYHFPWCAGAKQIAEKNLITFASIEEARKAGYTPASNCKGLK